MANRRGRESWELEGTLLRPFFRFIPELRPEKGETPLGA